MNMLNKKQKIILIIVLILVILIIIVQYVNSTKEIYSYEDTSNIVETEEIKEIVEKEEKIVVHVTGAVKKNGVVEIKENARINDVIKAAGGITEDADLTNVNLAYIVEDGQKIYIPSKNDMKESKVSEEDIITETAGQDVLKDGKKNEKTIININKTNLEGLKTLPGIGESMALKILEYREKNGKFKNINELKNVQGIGDSKFEMIKDFICI